MDLQRASWTGQRVTSECHKSWVRLEINIWHALHRLNSSGGKTINDAVYFNYNSLLIVLRVGLIYRRTSNHILNSPVAADEAKAGNCMSRHRTFRCPHLQIVGVSGGSGVFILGATGVATLSSGGTQLILSRWTTGYVIAYIKIIINTSKFIS